MNPQALTGGLDHHLYRPTICHLLHLQIEEGLRFNGPERSDVSYVRAKKQPQQSAPPKQGTGDSDLGSYSLGYCKGNFVSTYPVYHSYQVWSDKKTVEALQAIEIPLLVIMGQNDDRFGSDWLQRIRGAGVAVREIPDANHFFDSPHEFDFHDALLQALD